MRLAVRRPPWLPPQLDSSDEIDLDRDRARYEADRADARPSPFGVTFTGRACSEPRLLALAYAFEQATRRRVPPPDLP